MDFVRRLYPAAAAVVLITAATACGPAARPVPAGPNLLVITADTLRSDHLGCYGLPGGHTPNIDGLAASGMLFGNCTTAMATTFPSHATMFSGLYPRYHGVRWNGHRLHDSVDTLAELLYERGWDTAAFVALKAMLERGGLEQGFASVSDTERERGADLVRSGWEVNDLFAGWLDSRDRERPFFAWIHYYEPHSPYPVTPYAAAAMERAGYSGPFAKGASVEMLKDTALMDDPANRQALEDLYTGRVRETDELVGEVLDLLAKKGLGDKTIIVFASDHGQMLGESLGEQRRVGHGAILFEPAMRVPLIIRDPSRPGGRTDARAGLVDLMPTALDLLGISAVAGIHGRSLRGILDGEAIEDAPYLAEIRAPQPGTDAAAWVDRIAVYNKRIKVIFPEGLVYDLSRAQPDAEPVPPDPHGDLIAKMKRAADVFFAHTGGPDAGYDLDDEDYAGLRALGYIK